MVGPSSVLWNNGKNGSLRLNIVSYKEKELFLEQLLYFE